MFVSYVFWAQKAATYIEIAVEVLADMFAACLLCMQVLNHGVPCRHTGESYMLADVPLGANAVASVRVLCAFVCVS